MIFEAENGDLSIAKASISKEKDQFSFSLICSNYELNWY